MDKSVSSKVDATPKTLIVQYFPKDDQKKEKRQAKVNTIVPQWTETLTAILNDLPLVCDRDTKCNVQGYKNSTNGYKLHIDTAVCGMRVSALLTRVSAHDSQTVLPQAMTPVHVTNLQVLIFHKV